MRFLKNFHLSIKSNKQQKNLCSTPDCSKIKERVLSMKVINLGFTRTGTQSLTEALELLNYNPFGVKQLLSKSSNLRNLRKKYIGSITTPYSKLLKGYDATVGMPLCFQKEVLYHEYPHAKYILLLRDPEAWYKSMITLQNASKFIRRYSFFLPNVYLLKKLAKTVLYDGVFQGKTEKSDWLAFYEAEKQKVISLIPKNQLLLFDVKEGWEPLCRFLGKEIPTVPFPYKNKNLATISKNIRGLATKALYGTILAVIAALAIIFWARGVLV